MSERKIGVYICHCGGNISDHVDVEKVREEASKLAFVEVAKTTMFACSDAAQKEMEKDITEKGLDGLVVASCSPKLHTFTFRGVARRAGLNPYQYVQVNVREGCSWAHTDDPEGATEKAVSLIKAGVASTALTRPLQPIRLTTVPRAAVVGGGISGLRAAQALSDLGISVFVVEREERLGGLAGRRRSLFPSNGSGKEYLDALLADLARRDNVRIYTGSEVVEKKGSVGNFDLSVVSREGQRFDLNVGAVVVATGAGEYTPAETEYGFGLSGVVTLSSFLDTLEECEPSTHSLEMQGRSISSVAYIYCVGSRQADDEPGARVYCSRYCCGAAMHASILASRIDPKLRQYHIYRDIRTYGKLETLYEDANRLGAFALRWTPDEPPRVERSSDGLTVHVRDQLTGKDPLALEVDLVVLLTGLEPRHQKRLVDVFKLPLHGTGFFNEIHPKLRPVETVIDGVFVAGTCQAPRNVAESVASALSAVSKASALLLKGFVELDPLIASVKEDLCVWCGKCANACPYLAIGETAAGEKKIARVNSSLCKGCGACVPECPLHAIDLEGFTDEQIKAAIEAMGKAEVS